MPSVPDLISALVGRFDADVFDARRRETRVRLAVRGVGASDVAIRAGTAAVVSVEGRPDAVISADAKTWAIVAEDLRSGMAAYQAGRMSMRGNLHVGVGFLAATSEDTAPGRLRFRTISTPRARLSIMDAGTGPPILAMHGLGGTKGSFLPTVAALADRDRFRVIAVDLPGFGDSDKPLGAAYDAHYFAQVAVDLLDALGLERAHLIGNSLGGRVALEIALRHPDRVGRLALLAPSLAWRRPRPGLSLVRLTRPELGLVQLAPRRAVRAVVHRLIPGADEGWTAVGVDEFLRVYLTPSGRAAFYAAARQIYIDKPHGEEGFWTRLPALETDALFVWGRRDRLVPIAFARHIADALPRARHLELDCGHVPQVESPKQTHAAIDAFLAGRRTVRRRPTFAQRDDSRRDARRVPRASVIRA
jgi:pimeloyl-ACP methyl ester carboxylesterase